MGLEIMLTALICFTGACVVLGVFCMALVVSNDLSQLFAPILIPLLDLFRWIFDIP